VLGGDKAQCPPFRESPLCRVLSNVGDSARRPRIEAANDPLLIIFRLAKAGYGSVREIQEWDARMVLQALHYEQFVDDYERAYIELHKE